MQQTMVHETRRGNDHGIWVNVGMVGTHTWDAAPAESAYTDERQEEAIYAQPVTGGRRKWYVSYGGDYVPANRAERERITNRHTA